MTAATRERKSRLAAAANAVASNRQLDRPIHHTARPRSRQTARPKTSPVPPSIPPDGVAIELSSRQPPAATAAAPLDSLPSGSAPAIHHGPGPQHARPDARWRRPQNTCALSEPGRPRVDDARATARTPLAELCRACNFPAIGGRLEPTRQYKYGSVKRA